MTKIGWLAIYLVPLLWLSYSVIRSGLYYQYDIDELFHVQYAYLLARGALPFRDFYVGPYPPFFQYLLIPVLALTGAGWGAVFAMRLVMAGVFALRVSATAALVGKLFGRLAAALFTVLFLMDPFTVFSGGQIRPDNLMMLFFMLGLYLIHEGLLRLTSTKLWWAGLFLGLSVVCLPKIIPSVLVALVVAGIFLLYQREKLKLWPLAVGFFSPLVIFTAWLSWSGSLPAAYLQLVSDLWLFAGGFRDTVTLVNFYWPDNIYVFGIPGTPISWVYAIVFLLLGAGGWQQMLLTVLRSKRWGAKEAIVAIIAGVGLVNFLLLFLVKSVFLQYFLPVSWVLAVGGSVGLAAIYSYLPKQRVLTGAVICVSLVIYVLISWEMAKVNTARSTISVGQWQEKLSVWWTAVPVDATVFPAVLFRPLGLPLLNGYFQGTWDLAPQISGRYPLINYLQTGNIEYLVLNPGDLVKFDAATGDYISAHYQLLPETGDVRRKKTVR